MNIIHKLRGKFDESYRIRHGWGLSPIRNNKELEALIDFCEEQLQDTEVMNLNPAQRNVFITTIMMFDDEDIYLHEYINENMGWYWS